jgi:hypothetical protein
MDSIFHLLFFLFSQIYKPSIYHLHISSCALASYHPLLTTWTSKFDRIPKGPRYLRRADTQTDKWASQLIAKMPNNEDARRDKREKKKNRVPSPPEKQVPAESVESFLSRSSADSGFQGDDDNFSWESIGGQAALDNSLSSFARSSSVSETRQARKERKKRERSELLAQELDNEPDVTLSDESVDKEDSGSRKLSLSPTQFLQSRATGLLNRSRSMRQEAMENPSAPTAPIQVSEAKGKEAAVDVPVEAVACEVASGVNTTQQDDQGLPQGSPSVSFPSPTFNMPPTEHVQALHCNLAAELIHAGSGRSPHLPSRIRFPQEPGTAVSMTPIAVARRNNPNPSLQAHADNRTVDELRDELHRFGEACQAIREESLQSEAQDRIELARV